VHGPAGPVLLDDIAGTGWRIVTDLPVDRLPAGLLPVATGLGMLVSLPSGEKGFTSGPHRMQTGELDGVVAGWLARHRVHAAVVRPDHYVYGVANDGASLFALVANLKYRLQ
jgi:3-(3-hydroxy-phenyl)propionate hydroxylase